MASFSPTFSLLGPFQLGTRESDWGSDPTSIHGGFPLLTPATATIPSANAPGGNAAWSTVPFTPGDSPGKGSVRIHFPVQNETQFYGWTGSQAQGWLRGSLAVDAPADAALVLYVTGALEYRVNGTPVYGDLFAFRRAGVLVRARAGEWSLEVRVASDVRAFGGAGEISVGLEAVVVEGVGLAVEGAVKVGDVVGGRVAGEWAEVGVRNEGGREMEVVGAEGEGGVEVEMVREDLPVRVVSGQTRPVKVRVKVGEEWEGKKVGWRFKYREVGGKEVRELKVETEVNVVRKDEPQKFTYLHPSGVVSYSIVRPPSSTALRSCGTNVTTLPILISLHGAGVEADSPVFRGLFDEVPDLCGWLLMPSGVTSWSGDDWHRWGFADMEAAVAALPGYISTMHPSHPRADTSRWVVTGQSNGGQGTWYTLTHHPDRVLAAASVCGWLSVQAYVPYSLWHDADPRKTAVVQSVLASYNHELLAANAKGKKVFLQHGDMDDNVPVWHSRRMRQLISEAGGETTYQEVPGMGHWWDGMVTHGALPEWYQSSLKLGEVPELGEEWEFVVANPGDTGSRGGIKVEQLEEPDRLGRVKVRKSGIHWSIWTTNIRRFTFLPSPEPAPKDISVDGTAFHTVFATEGTYLRAPDGRWSVDTSDWKSVERHGSQLGGLDAILSTQGRIRIVLPPNPERYHHEVALDISRKLYQYYAADTEILGSLPPADSPGNVILLDLPERSETLSKDEYALFVKPKEGRTRRYYFEPGLGAVILQARQKGGVVMSVWGYDEEGLRTAGRLVPGRTGVGAPEFMVVGREMGWKGVDGAKVLGRLDERWRLVGEVSE